MTPFTVERPLRLNFAVTDDRLARLRETGAFANLATSKKRKDTKAAEAEIAAGKQQQKAILTVLETLHSLGIIKNREIFSDTLKKAFSDAEIKLPAGLFKSMLLVLSERDETADICTDNKGQPEPDAELRDFENVPLKENIDEYFKREVLPHVPDAWIDYNKTVIGYEIPFNRHFYHYEPPRPLEVIQADIKTLEHEIVKMLAEVTK